VTPIAKLDIYSELYLQPPLASEAKVTVRKNREEASLHRESLNRCC
jgi:hypothetical protein